MGQILHGSTSGPLATCASSTICPCSLITQMAVFTNDTSNPTNNLIPQSPFWIRFGNSNGLL